MSTKFNVRMNNNFSLSQIGSITDIPEPVSINGSFDMIAREFISNPSLQAVPVESDGGVIGMIERKECLKKGDVSIIQSLLGQNIKSHLSESAIILDSKENVELALDQIHGNENGLNTENCMVYHNGHYFGLLNVQKLVSHILGIRHRELERAKSIQSVLMGSNYYEDSFVRVSVLLDMAHELGGDFYQIKKLNSRYTMISCYDVSGKNISASLCTSLISAYFTTLELTETLNEMQPSEIVSHLHNLLLKKTPDEIFIAGLFIFLDKHENTLSVYNHGYSTLYSLHKTEKKTVVKNSSPQFPPLGLGPVLDYEDDVFKLELEENLKLFTYSDGLTDAHNSNGRDFGEDRVKKFISQHFQLGCRQFTEKLKHTILDYIGKAPRTDDITALFMDFS